MRSDIVPLAHPAERAHRVRERDAREHERRAEPERVGEQQDDRARDRSGRAREHEDRRKHGADARRCTDSEGAAEQNRRTALADALHELRRKRPFGPGQQPDEPDPITTSAKPAISVCVSLATTLAIAAAPAPRMTKTTVKPAMNGRLAATILLPTPRSPKRSTSIAETAER